MGDSLLSFKSFLKQNNNNEYILEFNEIFKKEMGNLPEYYTSSKNIINLLDINFDNNLKKNIFKKVYLEMYFKDTLLFVNF